MGSTSVVNDSISKRQAGAGKLTLLVFGLLAGTVLYSAWHILPFYYCYFELQNNFETAAKLAGSETDQEINARLWAKIKDLEIPGVERQDIKIERENGLIRIRLRYEEVFYVTFRGKDYDIRVFPFLVEAQGKY